jgi:hypothetical protein
VSGDVPSKQRVALSEVEGFDFGNRGLSMRPWITQWIRCSSRLRLSWLMLACPPDGQLLRSPDLARKCWDVDVGPLLWLECLVAQKSGVALTGPRHLLRMTSQSFQWSPGKAHWRT